jgi:hypothetical protein
MIGLGFADLLVHHQNYFLSRFQNHQMPDRVASPIAATINRHGNT